MTIKTQSDQDQNQSQYWQPSRIRHLEQLTQLLLAPNSVMDDIERAMSRSALLVKPLYPFRTPFKSKLRKHHMNIDTVNGSALLNIALVLAHRLLWQSTSVEGELEHQVLGQYCPNSLPLNQAENLHLYRYGRFCILRATAQYA